MRKKCRDTNEVETEKEKRAFLNYIKEIALHKHPKRPMTKKQARMEELLGLITSNRKLGL
jgi:hypothetical protein